MGHGRGHIATVDRRATLHTCVGTHGSATKWCSACACFAPWGVYSLPWWPVCPTCIVIRTPSPSSLSNTCAPRGMACTLHASPHPPLHRLSIMQAAAPQATSLSLAVHVVELGSSAFAAAIAHAAPRVERLYFGSSYDQCLPSCISAAFMQAAAGRLSRLRVGRFHCWKEAEYAALAGCLRLTELDLGYVSGRGRLCPVLCCCRMGGASLCARGCPFRLLLACLCHPIQERLSCMMWQRGKAGAGRSFCTHHPSH